MLLVDLNYNFEFDWFVELSDNKLSDNNLASELVGNRSFPVYRLVDRLVDPQLLWQCYDEIHDQ